jgi:hypothetical protein
VEIQCAQVFAPIPAIITGSAPTTPGPPAANRTRAISAVFIDQNYCSLLPGQCLKFRRPASAGISRFYSRGSPKTAFPEIHPRPYRRSKRLYPSALCWSMPNMIRQLARSGSNAWFALANYQRVSADAASNCLTASRASLGQPASMIKPNV